MQLIRKEEREYLDEGRIWDSRRDLSQKAGRSGIVDKGPDGVELCWGLNWPWQPIRGGCQGELFRFLLRE